MAQAQKRGKSWAEVKPSNMRAKYSDLYERFKIPNPPEFARVRLLGDVYELIIHWVPTKTKQGADSAYPVLCRKNNGDAEKCACCAAGIKEQRVYLVHAIIRDEQEDRPAKSAPIPEGTEFRKPGDKWWSPVRVLQLPGGAIARIQRLGERNTVADEGGKAFDISHPKYGRDLTIALDPNQTGSGMYEIQKEDRSPLTKEERKYLLYDLDSVYDYVEDNAEIMRNLASSYERGTLTEDNCDLEALHKLLVKFGLDSDVDDDDDDEEERPSKSKKGGKGKKRSRDEDDDDEDDLDDEDDEEEERPAKKAKSSKSKKRSRDEDDEDDEDLDDDDLDDPEEDDEDEKPRKSKKSKPKDEDDEDDEDDDLEDEDEEEPRKSSKSKKGGKSKKRSRDEDEDDDDLEDDDLEDEEDEEEEERSSKSKKSKGKSEKRRSRDEDDDDEEEERPAKKSKKGGKRKN